MILATHNSLSYIKSQWYLRLFAWVGRCQNKTIQEQYDLGVRYFDIRVKYNGYTAISGHGLLTYNTDILKVIKTIANFNESCIVRITLENTKEYCIDRGKFIADCYYWEQMFPDITFVGGCQKKTWDLLYEFEFKKEVNITEKYWLFSKKHWFPFPKRYAWLHNKEYEKIETDGYLMLDFVGLNNKENE